MFDLTFTDPAVSLPALASIYWICLIVGGGLLLIGSLAGGDGRAIAGAAMGRAHALSESLAMIETILGIDMRELSKNIAGNIAKRNQDEHAPKSSTTPSAPR